MTSDMQGYYTDRLAGERLKACYEVAPERTRRYLAAEIAHVIEKVSPGMRVVELGCGYGRLLEPLSERTGLAVGIDTSRASIRMAKERFAGSASVRVAVMDAVSTSFGDGVFDGTLCLQNGISAFHVDRESLFREAVRITRPGGLVLFSSYAEAFWPHRLAWFEAQAARGLIGAIDYEATGNGVIVCRDGFHASTVDGAGFKALALSAGQEAHLVEVDRSSLFCEMTVKP